MFRFAMLQIKALFVNPPLRQCNHFDIIERAFHRGDFIDFL
jgi:hypothetical protein